MSALLCTLPHLFQHEMHEICSEQLPCTIGTFPGEGLGEQLPRNLFFTPNYLAPPLKNVGENVPGFVPAVLLCY